MAGGYVNPRSRIPGANLKVKPGFKVDSSKIGLTGPGTAPDAETKKPYPIKGMGAQILNERWQQPGSSGPSPESGWRDGKYVEVPEPIKSRGRVSSPESYAAKQKRADAAYGKTGRAAPGDRVTRGESKTKPSPTDGTPGAPRPSKEQEPKSSGKSGNRGGGKADGATNSASSSTSSQPQRQTRPSSPSDSKKMAPASPGSLSYFIKKAKQSGDKNVQRRAYQMWKNARNSPGKVGAAGMSIAQKDLPKNPKKGDTVKGKAGVTWTWNGSRWTRGKAD